MSHHNRSRALHSQLSRWRWLAPVAVVILAGVGQLLLATLQPGLAPAGYPWLAMALYGLGGGLAAWVGLGWLDRQLAGRARTEAELRAAHRSLAETHRQLLAAHDIGREIASASDMQKVLELAARAPSHLAGAKGSTIITFDQERNRLKLDMAWGLSDDYLSILRRRMEAGVSASRCLSCRPLAARLDGDCVLFGGMDEVARREGIQSLVCLPLKRDSQCEGFISAYFPSPDGPPAEQLQLLNIVATEIATALDSARLRSHQKSTLYVIERLAQAEPDLDGLLEQVLDITLAGWGISRGAILLYDESSESWPRWTQRGLSEASTPAQFELAVQLAEEARQRGQPILIPELSPSPADGHGLRSVAVAPLLEGARLLGVLLLATDQAGFFQPRQSPFLAAIAHQATLAISNAQLHGQVQHLAILEERYRLSREIHDGLAQTLSSLGWHLDYLAGLLASNDLAGLERELETGRKLVREASLDVREAIDGLRLPGEQGGDLAATLAGCVAEFQERSGLSTALTIESRPGPLPAELELQLVRIVQEALTNIRKHARAAHVSVRLEQPAGTDRLSLTIADDGIGFDPALPRRRGHLGMSTMRERAQSQNGDLSIVTGPHQGTRITVTVPLPTDQKLPIG